MSEVMGEPTLDFALHPEALIRPFCAFSRSFLSCRQAAGALRGLPNGAHHRAGGRDGLDGHVQRLYRPSAGDLPQGHPRALPDHHREPAHGRARAGRVQEVDRPNVMVDPHSL